MDTDRVLILLGLIVTLMVFGGTHWGERTLNLLRRNSMRERATGKGLRESIVLRIWAKRYIYGELFHVLRIASMLAIAILGFVGLSRELEVTPLVQIISLFGLLALLVLLRPLAVKLAERTPDSLLLGFTGPSLLLLWPMLPLASLTYRTMQMGRRSGQPAINGGSDSKVLEEEETMEERIAEQPLDPDERRMIGAILEMEDTVVREIMKPRVDVIALDVELPLDQVVAEMVKSGHSRVPVFEETLDNILGILYSRDLLAAVANRSNGEELNLRDLLRQPFVVPETKRVDELLREFQEQRVRMGVVIDEYGGVEGIVTMEDLLEEIVGELEDEYQAVTEPTVQTTNEGSTLVDARIRIEDFNEIFNTQIDEAVFETLAGFLYSKLGKIPTSGDTISENGLTLDVLTTMGRRIKQVKVTVTIGDDTDDKEQVPD